MSDNKLVLHPANPNAVFNDSATLINKLKKNCFLGESKGISENPYSLGEHFFETGKNFLKLVDFYFSHKALVLDNPSVSPKNANIVDSKKLCYISIPKPSLDPQYLGGFYTPSPNCPNCDYQYSNPFELIDTWFKKDKFISAQNCPECEESFFINELDWEKCVGFSRQTISIWNVRAGEAIPSDKLLTLLQNITNTDWTYFYSRL